MEVEIALQIPRVFNRAGSPTRTLILPLSNLIRQPSNSTANNSYEASLPHLVLRQVGREPKYGPSPSKETIPHATKLWSPRPSFLLLASGTQPSRQQRLVPSTIRDQETKLRAGLLWLPPLAGLFAPQSSGLEQLGLSACLRISPAASLLSPSDGIFLPSTPAHLERHPSRPGPRNSLVRLFAISHHETRTHEERCPCLLASPWGYEPARSKSPLLSLLPPLASLFQRRFWTTSDC